jgi:hypothetical protein
MKQYNKDEDFLDQAINSQDIPRGADPVWYAPIKNMDQAGLIQALSCLGNAELRSALGWEGAAQWKWHFRTALGYAIWRGNLEAVKILIQMFGVNVKDDVAQNESSCIHYDGGVRFTSLAYCVVIQAHEPMSVLLQAGASKEDWDLPPLYNFGEPDQLASFWKSGGAQVNKALEKRN